MCVFSFFLFKRTLLDFSSEPVIVSFFLYITIKLLLKLFQNSLLSNKTKYNHITVIVIQNALMSFSLRLINATEDGTSDRQ